MTIINHQSSIINQSIWLFGYGSLIWRPSFPFVQRQPAWVHGWTRRFYQASTDHRGVPGAPGRVVTLIKAPEALCWGMAYQLPTEEVDAVLEHLDHREKGGYSRHSVRLNFQSAEFADASIDALIYIGTPENPNYAGPASEEEIAAIAATAHGPSGSNVEYILRLADALQDMGAHDPHVYTIAELLRA